MSSTVSTSVLTPQRPAERVDWGLHFEKWNSVCARFGTKPLKEIPDCWMPKFKARLKEYPDIWERIEEEARNIGQWAREKAFITFAWILSPNNLAKLLNGDYRPKGQR